MWQPDRRLDPQPHGLVLVFWKTAGSLGLADFYNLNRDFVEFGTGRAREPELKSRIP